MRFVLRQDAVDVPGPGSLAVAEHGTELCGEQIPQVDPEHAVGSVEHVRRTYGVHVLHAVGEGQAAAVVGALGGVIVVVLVEVPAEHAVGVGLIADEAVFRPVVDHEVALGEHVVIEQAIHVEVVGQLGLELRGPVRCAVELIGHSVIGHSRVKGLVSRSVPIRGNDPGEERLPGGLVCCARGLRVAELEVGAGLAVPGLGGKIVGLEPRLRIVVVPDLNTEDAGVVAGLAEDGEVLLGVVQIARSVEDRFAGGDGASADGDGRTRCIREEHAGGNALDRVADGGVVLPHLRRGGLVGVVVISQEDVVRVLRGSDVCLEVEVVHGDRAGGHGVAGDRGTCAVDPGRGVLEIQVQVERGQDVLQGARALGLHGHALGNESVVVAALGVDQLNLAGDFILLRDRHLVGPDVDDAEIGRGSGQLRDADGAVAGKDVVALIAGDHLSGVGAVGNEVVLDLVAGQAGAVHLDPVDPDVGVVGADLHQLRRGLHPVVRAGVCEGPGRTVLKPDRCKLVGPGFDVQIHLDLLILAVADRPALEL